MKVVEGGLNPGVRAQFLQAIVLRHWDAADFWDSWIFNLTGKAGPRIRQVAPCGWAPGEKFFLTIWSGTLQIPQYSPSPLTPNMFD